MESQETIDGRPIVPNSSVLSLGAPRLETYVPVGPPALRAGELELKLELTPSPALDSKKSRITVLWNERQVGTWSIAELAHGGIPLLLGDPDAGYHRLTFLADLFVQGDSCGEDRSNEAWIEIGKKSRLLWREQAASRPTVSELVAEWTARGVAGIEMADPLSPDLTIAYLHALEVVSAWNVRIEEKASARLRFEIGGEEKLVLLSTEGTSLIVKAPSETSLAQALFLMKSEDFLASCAASSCFLRPLRPSTEEGKNASVHSSEQTHEEAFVRLKDQFPGGWEVPGRGKRRFGFSWRRPHHWTVREGARFELLVKVPRADAGTLNREIALGLELNGVVLDRWLLTDKVAFGDRPGVLQVTIPEPLFGAEVWDFVLTAEVTSQSEVTCAGNDKLPPAAFIEPGSNLRLPHFRTEGDAISDLALSFEKRPPLRISNVISRKAAHAVASVLLPLARRFPDAPWRLAGKVLPDRSNLEQSEVIVGHMPSEGSAFEVVSRQGRDYLAPRTADLNMALLPLENSLVIERKGAQLTILCGALPRAPGPDGFVETDLTQLGAPIALMGDRGWRTVGARTVTGRQAIGAVTTTPDGPAIISEKATTYIVTNVIWALVTLVLLGGLLLLFKTQTAAR